MTGYKVKSPILFLAFNRLDTTKQVFEKIASVQPDRLYIACDGARKNKNNEEGRVSEVREWLMSNISWPCEVKTLFRENNLGCKPAVSGAISWFFDQEEMGIILEDDCLPVTSFFPFCDELLELYKTNTKIMSIGGSCHFDKQHDYPESYHFSDKFHCWGWASWRRAWSTYDVDMKGWPAFKANKGLQKLPQSNYLFTRYWTRVFDLVYNGDINTWDYQMTLNIWMHAGLCISPSRNLIKNIGFNEFATHTLNHQDKNANRQAEDITFPITHPRLIQANIKLDMLENKQAYGISWRAEITGIIRRRLSKIKQLLKRTLSR